MIKKPDALREVVIDPSGDMKFIVATINGCDDYRNKLFIRASKLYQDHRSNLFALNYEMENMRRFANRAARAVCIGGGRITINPKKKTILIYGESGDFGKEPDRQQTVKMLQAAYPKFKVVASLKSV